MTTAVALDPKVLAKLNKSGPRYTSYPTAPEWKEIGEEVYRDHLRAYDQTARPLSLYFHIPFCESMCLYCGCSVILNRKKSNEERYVDYLCQEIEGVTQALRYSHPVVQLHFGGGTPTKLSEELIVRLYGKIIEAFALDPTAEIAIEIDPRTVVEDQGKKLRLLRQLGFNRVSFGVQDTDPKVQEAVRRRQSLEMTCQTYHWARELGFEGINIDLIYGLPYQTRESFYETVEEISALRPDRIAMYSYAKVPWLKLHQKAIPDETLPTTEEKFAIYAQARQQFQEAGYLAIGMDHFCLETDSMAEAYREGSLYRNFMGYATHPADDMLGFGVTSIGYLFDAYFQNTKELSQYYSRLDNSLLPPERGHVLDQDDLVRKWVIHTLMCQFVIHKREFQQRFGASFDDYFDTEIKRLQPLVEEGLIVLEKEAVRATEYGELFIRNVAAAFDKYLHRKEGAKRFSQTV